MELINKISKKIFKLFRTNEFIMVSIILIFVALLSYGKTLNMFFWVDDWGVAYKMIHPEAYTGNFGAGVMAWGNAYRFNAAPFLLLYPIFGINVFPYFLIGLLQFIISAIVVYYFAKELFENKTTALGSAVIYTAGYVGSFAMYRVSNSWQLAQTTIFIYLSAMFLLQFLKEKKKTKYYISILFFISAIVFTFLRAHGIILVVLAVLLFYLITKKKKEIKRLIMTFLPFLLIYVFFYFIEYKGNLESNYATGSSLFSRSIVEIVIKGNWALLNNLFQTIANILFPQKWSLLLSDLIGKYFLSTSLWLKGGRNLAIILGYAFVAFPICLLLIDPKEKKTSTFLLIGIIVIIANVLSYFLYMPKSVLETINRYLMPASVGAALYWVVLLNYLSNKLCKSKYKVNIFWIAVGVLSASYIIMAWADQSEIIRYINKPTIQFRELLKTAVVAVDDDTLFFFDSEDEPRVKNNIVSSFPQLAITIWLDREGYTKVVDRNEEFFTRLVSNEVDIENIYTFFVSEDNGYQDTTSTFKKLLKKKEMITRYGSWQEMGSNTYELEISYPTLTPNYLTLALSAVQILPSSVNKYPVRLYWLTENSDTYKMVYSDEIEIIVDGLVRDYRLIIPAGGRSLYKLRIEDPSNNLEFRLKQTTIQNLTFDDIVRENLFVIE